MSFLSVLSFVFSAFVLLFGLYLSSKDMLIFFDKISLFIVFGGTLAATSISFSIKNLIPIFKIFLIRVFRDVKTDYTEIISDLMKLSELNRANIPLEKSVAELKDLFLKDAMISFTDQVLDKRNLLRVVKSRADNIYQHYLHDAGRFKTISKFPPAFGMMGTTIGMIVLLSKLSGADAAKHIGPAMSICLITTMYGVALANLLLIPIAENLIAVAKEQYFKNMIITEGVKLIYEKTNPVELAEILNAFLRPGDRLDWKNVIKKGISGGG